MSLLTRCPACQTLFRVVPDQLRIAEGWVRCGQCDEIFDASLHLLPGALTEPVATPDPEPPVPKLQTTASLDPAAQANPVQPYSDAPDTPDTRDHLDKWSSEPPQPSVPVFDDQSLLLDEIAPVPMNSEDLSIEAEHSDLLQSPLESDDKDDPKESDFEGAEETNDASFLRHHPSDSLWRRPLVRTTLLLLILLLLLGLSGQIVFHERDRILAAQPKLRPWLLALCEPLNCTLSPLRQIELITIESSSFVKIDPNTYRLSLALKNGGNVLLAMPAIEITLTDSQDQPVVRRVLMASELDAKSNTLPAGLEWATSLALALKATGLSNQITGYRLLAFYP